MRVIGLTGGVGSGKTVAANILQELLSAELLITDNLGHIAMKKGSAGYVQILDTFGEAVKDASGEINREQMAKIVFSDETKLQKLNAIIHPIVTAYVEEYIAKRKEKKGVIILESAILFESGCDHLCEEIWYLFVPEETRKARLKAGRGYSEDKSDAIMKKQMDVDSYRKKCQREIVNSGDVTMLRQGLQEAINACGMLGE